MGSRGDLWGALLLAGGLGYGYVTDFRPGSPVYSSLAAYRDQVAETGEELFTYTNDTVYAAVRDVGGRYPLSGCTDPGKTAVLVDSPAL